MLSYVFFVYGASLAFSAEPVQRVLVLPGGGFWLLRTIAQPILFRRTRMSWLMAGVCSLLEQACTSSHTSPPRRRASTRNHSRSRIHDGNFKSRRCAGTEQQELAKLGPSRPGSPGFRSPPKRFSSSLWFPASFFNMHAKSLAIAPSALFRRSTLRGRSAPESLRFSRSGRANTTLISDITLQWDKRLTTQADRSYGPQTQLKR